MRSQGQVRQEGQSGSSHPKLTVELSVFLGCYLDESRLVIDDRQRIPGDNATVHCAVGAFLVRQKESMTKLRWLYFHLDFATLPIATGSVAVVYLAHAITE